MLDRDRKRTLETLLELAIADDPAGCWDPHRAVELLRTRFSEDEAAEAGATEVVLDQVWPERRER